MCSCTGDPHCKPFCGNYFDVQGLGVFSLAKIGSEEVQMVTYVCRPKQRWSGGLTVKCNQAIAIRMAGGNVISVHKDKGARFNGKKVQGRGRWPVVGVSKAGKTCNSRGKCRGGQMAFVKKGARNRFTSYKGLKMKVRLWKSFFKKGAMGVVVSLYKGAKVSDTNGICGTTCSKLHKPKTTGRRSRGKKYPCKDCLVGVGYFGALCPCTEFVAKGGKQVFKTKFKRVSKGRVPKKPSKKKQKMMIKNFKRQMAKCDRSFKRTSFGRLAWRHKALRRSITRAAKACAFDRIASKGGNKRNMKKSVCQVVRLAIKRSKPSKLLCRIVKRCGMKSKKCRKPAPPSRRRRKAAGRRRRSRRRRRKISKQRPKRKIRRGVVFGIQKNARRSSRRRRSRRRRSRSGCPKYKGKHTPWCPWSGWLDKWTPVGRRR